MNLLTIVTQMRKRKRRKTIKHRKGKNKKSKHVISPRIKEVYAFLKARLP